ncbi:MAG: phosphate signaling complex protein PhoU [Bdellovibrionaceae bacterium]|nr:phosphate signaling complex protein PhoU [Bdellovibrio sp.]
MERIIDSQLEDLKKLMLEMGGQVEKALQTATEGLLKKENKLLQEVHKFEMHINDLQIKVDNACLQVLAKQGPVAKDLRLILSIIKINTDLERMGDQCVNIAHLGRELLERGFTSSMQDIETMSTSVSKMVKGSLDSFVKMDLVAAQKILEMDDQVDFMKNKVYKDSTELMKQQPQNIQTLMDFILIARNLERLGDHATNIAEDVIFAFSGKDVRHGLND